MSSDILFDKYLSPQQGRGWESVSQLILIPPSGANYLKYSQLQLGFYLFIILKHKHLTEIFVSSIPLYSN